MRNLLILIFVLNSSQTLAAEWKEVSSSDEFIYEYDITSIQKNKNTVTFWTKLKQLKPEIYQGKKVTSIIAKEVFNCDSREHKILFNYVYSDLEVISKGGDENAKYEDVVPGSNLENLFNLICNKSI